MSVWNLHHRFTSRSLLAALLLIPLPALDAQAQQVAGTPGSPGATTTIDGRYLPNPPPPFKGEISPNAVQSKPYWPARVVPPKGAPNILLIMTDDVGFAAPSTFGGVIPTPALDRIAETGLRYTAFHTTALCSPTRAALLTGRNHHSVATGVVVDQATGYPGYNSVIPRDAVAIGEILRQNGYDTSWYGKDHNLPQWEASQAGPFHNWPTGPIKGFDYYYGFAGDDTNQWQPGNLFRNTTPIQPFMGNPGWNLITAMADEAIGRIKMLNDVQPDRPFMIYYAPGGTHSPHHPTPEWIKKISDLHLFDKGWNELREQIFANQKKLGVIPQSAQLTAWPDSIPKWDTLSPEAKKLYIRQADVYAAYLAYTDHEIGRVIQAVADTGKLDNTLVIYVSGDNGASPEGTLHGLFNEFAVANAVHPTVEMNMKFYDAWGSDQTYPHYAVGWAWAWDTPYKWTKQVASYFGGTRNGMAMAWPSHIKDAGGIRHQFHHVIDVVPTILEAAGLPEPVMINGVAQKPIEGVSMAYSWDKANANAPSTRTTQYFEMFGKRAIYHDGWIASTPPPLAPWIITLEKPPADVMNGFTWELYNLKDDWTQANDLGAKMPDKLRDMQQLFTLEATKYQVFPLDDSILGRFISAKPSYAPDRTVFTYTGELSNVPFPVTGAAPSLLNRSYTITAEVDIPQGGGEGMLVTDGGRFAGYGFYLLKGRPVFTWNLVGLERVKWQGKDALVPGKHTLEFDWKYDGPGLGKGGTGVLKLDGKAVDSRPMPRSLPITNAWDEYFNVGLDTGTSVDEQDYQVPFRFTGKISKLTVKLGPNEMSPADKETVAKTMRERQ
ncbi:arylsulfatase [Bradyrhizobium japonicum]|uniref:arylsulfatase n=1 Tax=Bradyrhizobium japonicum TaxID=375 RepID=UPI001BA5F954|nr:arylsulfatase [Bradyrhizobium japonicum]MBR0957654.1 arylsulfatase [Bradyrhizobium japonicum]